MRTVGSRCFGGPPLSPGVATAVGCDAGSVAHVVDGSGAPLRLGRRHHELVHAGWRITGDPAGTLRFGRPAG